MTERSSNETKNWNMVCPRLWIKAQTYIKKNIDRPNVLSSLKSLLQNFKGDGVRTKLRVLVHTSLNVIQAEIKKGTATQVERNPCNSVDIGLGFLHLKSLTCHVYIKNRLTLNEVKQSSIFFVLTFLRKTIVTLVKAAVLKTSKFQTLRNIYLEFYIIIVLHIWQDYKPV